MRVRNDVVRETFAEFLGTFLLTLVGNAVMASLCFQEVGKVGVVAGPLGWGLALMLAIAITGGVSGCHANPAVTLGMASVGKLPWRKVMPYACAQYSGAFLSSVLLYALYYESFAHFDGGHREIPPHPSATAQIFSTYPSEHVGAFTCLGDQVVSTMLLVMAICAITDPNNLSVPRGSFPLLIGLSLSAIIFAFPYNCGAPLNPARDLAPRAFTALAGWGGDVFRVREYTYFWVPVLGPHLGGVLGAWAYRMLVEQHWPVDSYDLDAASDLKTSSDYKCSKETLPYVDKKKCLSMETRRSEE